MQLDCANSCIFSKQFHGIENTTLDPGCGKILADSTGAVDFQPFCGDSNFLRLLIPLSVCCPIWSNLSFHRATKFTYTLHKQQELIKKVAHKSVLT